MAPTLASALTLSAVAYTTKLGVKLLCKSVKVEGLPILLDALQERPVSIASSSSSTSSISNSSSSDTNSSSSNTSSSTNSSTSSIIGSSLNEGNPRKGKGKEREGTPTFPVSVGGEQGGAVMGRRGIVTVSNHNTVLDDPTMWSMLPTSNYFPFASPAHTSRNTRWTLGASDIMFTKPWHQRFFTNGQVIETFRGKGIFQPAVDQAVKLLQGGEWIHIFPEGRVNQEPVNPDGGLFRFKWGIGRIIMDSTVMPEIIPIWLSGYDQMMNENRGFPRGLPRPGANLSMTVGASLSDRIKPLVDQWRAMASREPGAVGVGGEWTEERGATGDGMGLKAVRSKGDMAEGREEQVRIKICEVLQEGVRELGERVERAEGRFERGDWAHSTSRSTQA